MNPKKLILLTLIEIIFFALVISSLVFVHFQTKTYLEQVQLFSPKINDLTNDLRQNNLTEANALEMQNTLKGVESLTSKALFLTDYALPLFFIIIFILFQIFYWKIIASTKYKIILIPALIQSILIIILTYFFLNWLSYALYGEGTSNAIELIIALILLTILTIFNLYYFAVDKSVKNTFKHIIKSRFKIWLNVIVFLIFISISIILAVLIYVFTQVQFSITIPIILLIISIFFSNLHRIYLVNKIKQ